jgi:hypothetical protein
MVDAPIVASTVGTRVSFALTLQDMATLHIGLLTPKPLSLFFVGTMWLPRRKRVL